MIQSQRTEAIITECGALPGKMFIKHASRSFKFKLLVHYLPIREEYQVPLSHSIKISVYPSMFLWT